MEAISNLEIKRSSTHKNLKNSLIRLAEILGEKGIEIEPLNSGQYLEALPEEKASELLERTKERCEIFPPVDKDAAFDQFLWKAVKDDGWKFESDLFGLLSKRGSIVEVYTSDLIHYCANYNFYKAISYTLEDIFCRPSDELYSRDQSIQEDFYKQVFHVLGGKSDGTLLLNETKEHWSYEKDSKRMNKALVKHKLLSPIKGRKGGVSGIIFVYDIIKSEKQQPRFYN